LPVHGGNHKDFDRGHPSRILRQHKSAKLNGRIIGCQGEYIPSLEPLPVIVAAQGVGQCRLKVTQTSRFIEAKISELPVPNETIDTFILWIGALSRPFSLSAREIGSVEGAFRNWQFCMVFVGFIKML
jgi:hypothetical protein